MKEIEPINFVIKVKIMRIYFILYSHQFFEDIFMSEYQKSNDQLQF